MDTFKLLILYFTFLLLLLFACRTDPINPPEGFITDPPIQDPGSDNPCDPGVISFQHQVLPIITSACAYSGCHDAATAEEGVIMDTYDHIKREVKAGDPNDSELYKSITENDREEIMPPPPASPLTNEQIAIIREWIVQGAKNTDCGTACDPATSSFMANIYPLLKDYCVGCHNSTRSDGNVRLDNYNNILPYSQNGLLLGTIRHDPQFAKMPPSGSKLSDCRVAQVQKWIDEGAQNN